MKSSSRQIMRSAEDALAEIEARRRIAEHGWNSDKVLASIVGGYRTLRKLPDMARHRAIRSVWPDDIYAKAPELIEVERFAAEVHAIQLGAEETKARQDERNRTVIPPTPSEIDQMTVSLVWPARYVEQRALRVVVMQCAVVRASDMSLRKLCRDRGWPYETTFARCKRAGKIIADGLNKDGVASW